MQQSEQKSGIPGHDYDRADTESLRMRKGKAGGFGDYLDDDDIALIEKRCGEELSPAAMELVRQTGVEPAKTIDALTRPMPMTAGAAS